MFYYKYMKPLDKKTFLQRVKETDFPKNKHAIVKTGKRKGKMSKAYTDYVKKNKGRVPILEDAIYNPKTQRFIKLSNVLNKRNTKNPKMRQNKQTKDFDLYFENGLPFLSTYRKLKLEPEFKRLKKKQIKSVRMNLDEFPNTKAGVEFMINSLPSDRFYKLIAGNSVFTLNDTFINKMLDTLTKRQYETITQADSIGKVIYALKNFSEITIEEILPSATTFLNGGSFFPYTVKTSHDLSQFGLFTEVKPSNYDENCLTRAFIAHGLSEDKINKLKTICRTREIPNRKLTEIADALKINIVVTHEKQRHNCKSYPSRNNKFTNEYDETFKLGCFQGHYFAIKDTGITTYALENEDKLKHKDRWGEFIYKKGTTERCKKRTMNSLTLFQMFLSDKEKWLKPISRSRGLYSSTFYDEMKDKPFDDLNYVDEDVELNTVIDAKYLKQKKITSIPFFVDFEAFWEERNGVKVQKAYLACWKNPTTENPEDNEVCVAWGRDCARKMLLKITEFTNNFNKKYNTKVTPAIYAHNMRYDWRHLRPEITLLSSIEPNGRFINATGFFFKSKNNYTKMTFKCTYNMIASPLRKFKKLFKLDVEKEAMPYNVYTAKNLDKEWINVNECLKHLYSDEDKQNFLSNAKKVKDCMIDDEVNIKYYAIFYCKKDVEVLYDGYMVFRQQIRDVCNELECKELDILDFNTQAKLANEIILACGCYEGVYKTSGIVQDFISRAKVGGRTMVRNNKKCYVPPVRALVGDKWETVSRIENRDANSLYPSAMCEMSGFLRGKPKVLTGNQQLNLDFLRKQDGFCVDITIKKIPKKYDFPLQSRLEDGIRMFKNNFNYEIGGNGELIDVCVDNYALEDLIIFHEVEDCDITVKRGYYFNEGFNNKVRDVIKTIYEKRQFYKKMKNPIEQAFKLIMNSSYGYSMLKPIDSELFHILVTDLDKHIERNFNYIKQIDIDVEGRYARVEHYKPIAKHYNNVMSGVQILSMSKRIMNRVMCLIEDLNIPMYYQDTDSIHLDGLVAKTKNLNEEYKKKYGKAINGEGLGYFSSDFEVNGCDDDKCYATSGVYLGKKCYYEDVWGVDKKKELHHDPHVRMKGVPEGSIIWKAKQLGISLYQLYTRLYHNGGEEFDLLVDMDGNEKAKFKFSNDYAISKVEKFKRYITFDENMRKLNKAYGVFNLYE